MNFIMKQLDDVMNYSGGKPFYNGTIIQCDALFRRNVISYWNNVMYISIHALTIASVCKDHWSSGFIQTRERQLQEEDAAREEAQRRETGTAVF